MCITHKAYLLVVHGRELGACAYPRCALPWLVAGGTSLRVGSRPSDNAGTPGTTSRSLAERNTSTDSVPLLGAAADEAHLRLGSEEGYVSGEG